MDDRVCDAYPENAGDRGERHREDADVNVAARDQTLSVRVDDVHRHVCGGVRG